MCSVTIVIWQATYYQKLDRLYTHIIMDYGENNMRSVSKWTEAALDIICFKRQHGNDHFPVGEEGTVDYFQKTEDMLQTIYTIEDVRPILIGTTEFEHVKTNARMITLKNGRKKMKMPKATRIHCKMAAAIYGLLAMMFNTEFDFFKNMESQIYASNPETLRMMYAEDVAKKRAILEREGPEGLRRDHEAYVAHRRALMKREGRKRKEKQHGR